jgi:hypothetical protein
MHDAVIRLFNHNSCGSRGSQRIGATVYQLCAECLFTGIYAVGSKECFLPSGLKLWLKY